MFDSIPDRSLARDNTRGAMADSARVARSSRDMARSRFSRGNSMGAGGCGDARANVPARMRRDASASRQTRAVRT